MGTTEWTTRAAVDILLQLGVTTIPVVMTAMIVNRPLTIRRPGARDDHVRSCESGAGSPR